MALSARCSASSVQVERKPRAPCLPVSVSALLLQRQLSKYATMARPSSARGGETENRRTKTLAVSIDSLAFRLPPTRLPPPCSPICATTSIPLPLLRPTRRLSRLLGVHLAS